MRHTDLLKRIGRIPPGHPFWDQLKAVLDDAEKEDAAQEAATSTDGKQITAAHAEHGTNIIASAGGAMQGGKHGGY